MGDRAHARMRANLDAVGWARALGRCEVVPPPGFEPAGETAADGGGETRPDVAGALKVLACRQVTVQVTVGAGGDRGMRAVLGLSGEVGAGLLALPDGGVQVWLFPAMEFAAELVRLVPAPAELLDPQERIVVGLGGGGREPIAGLVPLQALTQLPVAGDVLGLPADSGDVQGLIDEEGPRPGPDQAERARRLVRETRGVLQALVAGRVQVRGQVGVGVGQAVWFGTESGWVAGEPAPGPLGERWVRLRPVEPAELPAVLAPVIAQILTGGPDLTAAAGSPEGER